jgi:malate dehydrogenase (oxaloacetate-decarboxylating)
MKSNTVLVVSDGSAVLGLGNIGPYAAMPVMEGKAVLFKEFGGVNAFPICLDTQDTEEIIQIVKAIAPGVGGINLEDISAPRCFEIEERLKAELSIPVFHDDQHGTAIVVLAGIINALKVTGQTFTLLRLSKPCLMRQRRYSLQEIQGFKLDAKAYGRDNKPGRKNRYSCRCYERL